MASECLWWRPCLRFEKKKAHAALDVEAEKKRLEVEKESALQKALAEAARAKAKEEWAAQRAAQEARSGAGVVDPRHQRSPDQRSADDLRDLAPKKAFKSVAVNVMEMDDKRGVGVASPTKRLAVTLRTLSLRREGSQSALLGRSFKHQQTFSHSVKSLVNRGFRHAPEAAKTPKSGFDSVPLVKYCMRAVSHVLFLCLYFEVCTHLLTSLMTSDCF